MKRWRLLEKKRNKKALENEKDQNTLLNAVFWLISNIENK